MHALDLLIPTPRLLERDFANLAASSQRVWELVRHRDLARSALVRALFAVRTIPDRFHTGARSEPMQLSIDLLRSSPEKPGFQILDEQAPREITVGAIGKVWHLDIPFVHVADAKSFAAFSEPDYVKVAWSIRIEPIGTGGSRLCIEVRVDATDDNAWRKFRRYFRLIGPGSRFIRHTLLRSLSRELGTPDAAGEDQQLAVPGDDLLPTARAQATHHIDIDAPPTKVWPWLVQMGYGRGGWYSWDLLDNHGKRSADRIVAELQALSVGDRVRMNETGSAAVAVLVLDPPRALVLGDPSLLPGAPVSAPGAPRATWAFSLEHVGDACTHLIVRVRADYEPSVVAEWVRRFVTVLHDVMERKQLRTLKQRVEHEARETRAS
jgi:hypothetical protein